MARINALLTSLFVGALAASAMPQESLDDSEGVAAPAFASDVEFPAWVDPMSLGLALPGGIAGAHPEDIYLSVLDRVAAGSGRARVMASFSGPSQGTYRPARPIEPV